MTQAQAKTHDIPLAVWPCAQRTSQWQRHGRYLSESNRHPAKMLPELARRAIETYSRPGDLVVDPMCGIGTTMVEATHLDRHAVGIELEQRWADLAQANLAHARAHAAPGLGRVIRGDARELPRLLTRATRLEPAENVAALPYQSVDLVLTSPPYACEIGVPQKDAWASGHSLCPVPERNYSPSRDNLGHARRADYLAAMADIYAACQRVLKPGGFLVLVTKDMRAKGALRNLAGDTVALCEGAGLAYWQHVIALLATIRDDQLIGRPSFWQTLQIRRARGRGEHTHLVCHEDVLVFRRPNATVTAPAQVAAHARRAA